MKTRWYKNAVVYQIYPRSFMDSNGDGIGDLNGIAEKVDYIKNLGVDAVWISPCYKSPNDDNGYDISDYCDIMDEFGTREDWQNMLNAFHSRDIKVIMDLVGNPYRDYYIWRDGTGKDKKTPPNDWKACFGGSVWEYDENTEQFYLHLFSKKQPDLNWDNPKVRKEVENICNFWLEKGVAVMSSLIFQSLTIFIMQSGTRLLWVITGKSILRNCVRIRGTNMIH